MKNTLLTLYIIFLVIAAGFEIAARAPGEFGPLQPSP